MARGSLTAVFQPISEGAIASPLPSFCSAACQNISLIHLQLPAAPAKLKGVK